MRRRRANGQRKDWHGIVLAERANCWKKKKKTTEETGKAYQTGFQITEVIPSVIDSPIATYRISVGWSWGGNYKREETRARDRPREESKREMCAPACTCVGVCVYVCRKNGIKRSETER